MFEETVSDFHGFNITQLNMDQAWLNISSSFDSPVWLYSVSNDCHKCPLHKLLIDSILPNNLYKAVVNVQHGSLFRFRTSGNATFASVDNDSDKICDIDGSILGEFGVHSLRLEKEGNDFHCILETDLEPVNIYFPIVAIFAFWLLVAFLTYNSSNLYRMIDSIWTKLSSRNTQPNNDEGVGESRLPTNPLPNDDKSTTSSSDTDVVAVGDEIQGSGDDRVCDSTDDQQRRSGRVSPRKGQKKTAIKTKRSRQQHEHASSPSTKNTDKSSETGLISDNDNAKASSSSARPLESSQVQVQPAAMKKERLQSLDAFRGLCILIMIFADDGGGGYFFFEHCTWDGLYVADLAFPWFLWICGVCIALSIHSRVQNQSTKKMTIFKAFLVRSIKLVGLGIIVNTSTRAIPVQLENLRFPGVLQRFGICYFVCSTLYLFFSAEKVKSNSNPLQQNIDVWSWRRQLIDVKVTIIPWIFVFAFVILHTLLIFLLPVPGCPTGYLGPAGLHDGNIYPPYCAGGAIGYVDRLIFGLNHIYSRPTSQKVYGSGAFDPEGSLGILTSVLHTWIGVQAGVILILYKSRDERLLKFSLWSLLCGFGGIVLCGGSSNAGLIPVNKNLWSLSFVLVTSSVAFLILATMYLGIDVRKRFSGSPLMEAGKNSIFLYLAHEVCHTMLPWHFSYGRMRTHSWNLLESTWGTVLWMIVAVYLHKRRLYFVV